MRYSAGATVDPIHLQMELAIGIFNAKGVGITLSFRANVILFVVFMNLRVKLICNGILAFELSLLVK